MEYRQIVTLLFVGLFFCNITYAAKSTEPERMLQSMKLAPQAQGKVRVAPTIDNRAFESNEDKDDDTLSGMCAQPTCARCRNVEGCYGCGGTYEDSEQVLCEDVKKRKMECTYASAAECTSTYGGDTLSPH